MKHNNLMDRREFTLEAALAVLGGVAITVAGCGGDTSPSPTNPTFNPENDEIGTITANHGHSAVIMRAQLTTNNALSLNIRGSADHPHTVELSQSDVAAIAVGQRVSRTSSTDQAHAHTVTFN